MIRAHVDVMPRHTVLDPQGSAVERSLRSLGFDEVADVRIGRRITLQLEGDDTAIAHQRVTRMCEELLANLVIESYEFELVEDAVPAVAPS